MSKRLHSLFVRVPERLFWRVKSEAARRGMSMSDFVIAALIAFLESTK